MDWKSTYWDNFTKTEWNDKHDKSRYLNAYRNGDVKLADVPFMFVGIGGTGIDAVLTLKDKIEAIYDTNQADRIEYLLIDTDVIGSGRHIDPADTIVIQSADTAMLLREAQQHKQDSHFITDEICSWLDASLSPFRVMNGAAGIRQAGRLILFLNFSQIYDVLQRKINKISKGYDGSVCRPRIYLFTGIGGGTGSGMFVDLSYLIRNIINVDLTGIIFMPDVTCLKPNLREIHKRNIKRNGFAALKELDYLMTLDRFHEYFIQDYPGGIHVRQSYPIFDLCILVGAQEDGRKPAKSEQEVFEKTAEYILSEIQGKISGFGMDSFKSNLANKLPKEPFCDRYAAVGAAASYVPIDYYYGWWLRDVLEVFGFGGNGSKANHDIAEIQKDMKHEIAQASYHFESRYDRARAQMIVNMKNKIAAGNILPSNLFLLCGDNYKNAIANACEIIDKVSLSKIKRNGITRKLLLCKKRLREEYKSAYRDVYDKWLSQYRKECNIFKKIYEQTETYDIAKLDELPEQFLFGKQEFEQVRQQNKQYQESVKEAAEKLAEDFYKNYVRWNGTVSGFPKWLSDYIAKLLWDSFSESGCLNLEDLVKYAAINGYNGQEAFLHDSLSKLDARQLWPRSPFYKSDNDYHRVLAGPGEYPIKGWVESWLTKNGTGDIFCASSIIWRFARTILSHGYALYAYDGIRDLEIAYLTAPNRTGLHLYASASKNWNDLPSPYFETKWVSGDAEQRQKEKKRNEHYYEVFDEALNNGIIINGKDGFYYIKKDEALIRIGDISGNDILAKQMFIHMFEHRQWVEAQNKKTNS